MFCPFPSFSYCIRCVSWLVLPMRKTFCRMKCYCWTFFLSSFVVFFSCAFLPYSKFCLDYKHLSACLSRQASFCLCRFIFRQIFTHLSFPIVSCFALYPSAGLPSVKASVVEMFSDGLFFFSLQDVGCTIRTSIVRLVLPIRHASAVDLFPGKFLRFFLRALSLFSCLPHKKFFALKYLSACPFPSGKLLPLTCPVNSPPFLPFPLYHVCPTSRPAFPVRLMFFCSNAFVELFFCPYFPTMCFVH